MKADTFITGATGTAGGHLTRLFQEAGLPARAGVRNPKAARSRQTGSIEHVSFDFQRPETFARAFADGRSLFLVRPPAMANVRRDLFPAIEAAERAGVEHVVFLSLQGAENNPFVPHRTVEKRLLASDMAYTFLRPSFFMQNLSTTHREDLRVRDELFVPAGRGKTAFIDARDVAAVAFRALTQRGHENQAYTLTGREALDYYEVAAIFSEVLRRPIRYANPSLLAFAVRMWKRGKPPGFTLVLCALYTVSRLGLAGQITDETERLLGRLPLTMRTFVRDHRNCWTKRGESVYTT